MKSIFAWLFILIVIALGSLFVLSNENKKVSNVQDKIEINYVKLGESIIDVEIASTVNERIKGLSGRTSLPLNRGLLFVFESPSKNMFWMKDMYFPIDIIWLDENKQVIYIKENAEPKSYPELFGPEKNSKYVLEVSSGVSKKNNLKVGDYLSFF